MGAWMERLRRAIERGRGGWGRREWGTVMGEDEVRCERGRKGGLGRLPWFFPSLSRRKDAARERRRCGELRAGPPRCSKNPHPHLQLAATEPRNIPTPLQQRPAAAVPHCSRTQPCLRPSIAATRCGRAPLRPRTAAAMHNCSRAQLQPRTTAAAHNCSRAQLQLRPVAVATRFAQWQS
jgi:hypothetical protein